MGRSLCINLGCGYQKAQSNEQTDWHNVDGHECCNPDVIHDLNVTPLPYADNSADFICAYHVMEHLENWWECFCDCARILKPGGVIEIRVPHPSSDTAITYRDHLHVINPNSFDGISNRDFKTTNAWFESQQKIPVTLEQYICVPHTRYQWMPRFLIAFCGKHMRNFIHEQRFTFRKN